MSSAWTPRSIKLTTLLIVCVAVTVTALSLVFYYLAGDDGLHRIQSAIARQFPDQEQISGQVLAANLSDVVVFDVRQPGEFAVSHIAGAVRIPPDLTAEDFATQYASAIEGRKAVFYCSVGRRSSTMLERVSAVLQRNDATGANLARGIFGWHNDQRALVNAKGATEMVHPFSQFFEPLLERADRVAYEAP